MRFRIDQEKPNGVVIHAGGHDQHVGTIAADHMALLPAQTETVSVLSGPGFYVRSIVPGLLVNRQRIDFFAGCDFRKVFGLLSVCTAIAQCRGTKHGGSEERCGRQCAAHLLKDEAGGRESHIHPAKFLGNDNAIPAHIRHVFPDGMPESVLAAFVAKTAELGNRGFFGQKRLRTVAQHLFFFG